MRKGGRIMDVKPNEQTEKTDSEGNPIGPSKEYQHVLDNLGKKTVVRKNYQVKDVGVVSYFVDGYEKAVTPKTIKNQGESFFCELNLSLDEFIALVKAGYALSTSILHYIIQPFVKICLKK